MFRLRLQSARRHLPGQIPRFPRSQLSWTSSHARELTAKEEAGAFPDGAVLSVRKFFPCGAQRPPVASTRTSCFWAPVTQAKATPPPPHAMFELSDPTLSFETNHAGSSPPYKEVLPRPPRRRWACRLVCPGQLVTRQTCCLDLDKPRLPSNLSSVHSLLIARDQCNPRNKAAALGLY